MSIHAPTRGATVVEETGDQVVIVSIHAPTRGATFPAWRDHFPILFSIHAPTRARQNSWYRYPRLYRRGACWNKLRLSRWESALIPAFTGGEFPLYLKAGFNPRAHAGRDIRYGIDVDDESRFNPRAHAGRDLALKHDERQGVVSIHAPTRGATSLYSNQPPIKIVSIHAPTRARRKTALVFQ